LVLLASGCTHTSKNKSLWQGLESVQEAQCQPMSLGSKYIYPDKITAHYRNNLIIETVKRNGQPTLITANINPDLTLTKAKEISAIDGSWGVFSNSDNQEHYYKYEIDKNLIEKSDTKNSIIHQWKTDAKDVEEIIEIKGKPWIIHKDDKQDLYRVSFIRDKKTIKTNFQSRDYPKTIVNQVGSIQFIYGKNKKALQILPISDKQKLWSFPLTNSSIIESYSVSKDQAGFHIFMTEGDSMVGDIKLKYLRLSLNRTTILGNHKSRQT